MLISPDVERWTEGRSDGTPRGPGKIDSGEVIELLLRLIESRDSATSVHLLRTASRAAQLGAALGWPSHLLDELRQSASLHDVGKVAVPRAVLSKEGRLTPAEFRIVQSHTVIGARLLQQLGTPVFQLAGEIALYHHERWDGEGYPFGLKGMNIPFSARIVAVVDVFDALIENRVYRPALSPQEALDLMRLQRGRHFDPEILDSFIDLAQSAAWSEPAVPESKAESSTAVESAVQDAPRRRRAKRGVAVGWTAVEPRFSPA